MSKSTFRKPYHGEHGWKFREVDGVFYKRTRKEKHKRSGRP